MGAFLAIAFRNLVEARRRTLLVGGALAAVTALLVLLLALSQGLTDTLVRQATTLASGHVNVAGFYKANARMAAPIVTGAAEVRRLVEANVPEGTRVLDRARGWAKVVSESASLYAGLTGVDIREETDLTERLRVVHGDASRLAEPGRCLIFEAQAERLEVGVGDVLTLTTETMEGRSNTGEVEVVAVAKDVGFMSNWNVFVPKSTILDLYRLKPDTTGAIQVYLEDIDESETVLGHLRQVFEAAGQPLMDHVPQPFYAKFETVAGEDWVGQKLDLTLWSDEVSFLLWILTAVDTISYVLVTILLVIIGVGIMNTMWIAVRERTAEVGTLRAIGMSRPRVLQMFLLEAVLLGLAATTAGGALGYLGGLAIDAAAFPLPNEAFEAILMSDTLHLAVHPSQVARAILSFTALTALASLWPALRAARLQPVTAIHRVG